MKTQHESRFAAAIFLGCLLVWTGIAVSAEPVSFQRDVAPILQRRCLSCHNERDHRGELSLQSADALNAGGESGKVIETGNAESSYLLDLLTHTANTPH